MNAGAAAHTTTSGAFSNNGAQTGGNSKGYNFKKLKSIYFLDQMIEEKTSKGPK